MHWYGSSSLTVEQNGAMLNEQAGSMIQLAEENGIPEVWITEMGSGYDASAASEEVGLAPCLALQTSSICVAQFYDADIRGFQCQFIQWLESTFMTNASNSKITHYAYNEHMGTLLNGNSLTNSGSA